MQDTGDMDAAKPRLHGGIDLGSTGIKMLVIDDAGTELAGAQVPTPWRVGPGGTTDIDAADLLSAVRALVDLVDAELARVSSAPLTSLAVAGMGETGILIAPTAPRRTRLRVVRPARVGADRRLPPPRCATSSPAAPGSPSVRRSASRSSRGCATRAPTSR
ncbi:hypothetical protein HR12_23910, partial [Microbacterium sp. SUBG005]